MRSQNKEPHMISLFWNLSTLAPSPFAHTFTETLDALCDLLEPLRSLPAAEGAKVAAKDVMMLSGCSKMFFREYLPSKVLEWAMHFSTQDEGLSSTVIDGLIKLPSRYESGLEQPKQLDFLLGVWKC